MSFALPLAWTLLLIALPIIALYVLKVRLRRVATSTNMFWRQVYEEKPPRRWWQNLRHVLSLLAQLLILLSLVAAIADPTFVWQPQQARRVVLVLDASASMKAVDLRPTRLEAARAVAHQVLDGLRFGDEVAIIAAGSRPEVVVGMANHVPTLRRALDSVVATDNAGSLPAAMELAQRLIGQHLNGEIFVFSDGCHFLEDSILPAESVVSPQTDSAPAATATTLDEGPAHPGQASSLARADGPRLHVFSFATDANNVAITQFQARRSLVDPLGYEILLAVRNHSSVPIVGRVEITLNEQTIDVLPLKLQSNELWTRTLEKTTLEGGQLHASLVDLAPVPSEGSTALGRVVEKGLTVDVSSINALESDDQAWAMIPPRQVQDVLIVSPGSLFLRKVFEANPLVKISVTDTLPEQWPAESIIVLHRRMPESIPAGRVLVVDPETDTDLWSVGDSIQNPIITDQVTDSPLMSHIRFDNVLIPEARRLEYRETALPLASTLDGEAIFAIVPRSGGACLVLGVNLERSDLAFRTAFPILVTNALTWFAGQTGEVERSWSGGEMAAVDSGRQVTTGMPLRLVSPQATEIPVAGTQMGPLDQVGLWQLVLDDGGTPKGSDEAGREGVSHRVIETLAVNLSNDAESDLRPRQPANERNGASAESANQGGDRAIPMLGWFARPLWFYLAMATALFLVIEWGLYQRRLIS